MFRYLLVSNGLAATFVVWLFVEMPGSIRALTGVLLACVVVGASLMAGSRVRRLRSNWEGRPPQVIRHDGGGGRRGRPKSTEDPEFFVGDRW